MSGGKAFVGALRGALLRILLVIAAMVIPFAVGLVRFVDHLPPPTADQSRTDAIVVLTGGGERIPAALALLEAGKAERLFVSGVHHGVGVAALLKIDREGVPPLDPTIAQRIDLGDTAGDTFGNSVESVAWMRANHFKSMRLVTADYHMPRALIEFHLEAPDIAIVPNPVLRANAAPWWQDRTMSELLAGEYAKFIVVKWRFLLARLTDQT